MSELTPDAASIPAIAEPSRALAGFGYAMIAYVLWAALPLYLRLLAGVPAAELAAHRVIWTVPLAGAWVLLQRRFRHALKLLAQPRKLGLVSINATLLAVNSLTYIYAISTHRALDAALGYYIAPLMAILIGAAFLGERLNTLKLAVILLASAGIVLLSWGTRDPPWLAIIIALTWSLYAFFKKSLPLAPAEGFFLEMVLLAAPALAYLLWLQHLGAGHFALPGKAMQSWLLIGSGLTVAAPLIAYAYGAKLLPLSTIGVLQYITPSVVLLIAVGIFHEPFGLAEAGGFACIWAAVILYITPQLLRIWR